MVELYNDDQLEKGLHSRREQGRMGEEYRSMEERRKGGTGQRRWNECRSCG